MLSTSLLCAFLLFLASSSVTTTKAAEDGRSDYYLSHFSGNVFFEEVPTSQRQKQQLAAAAEKPHRQPNFADDLLEKFRQQILQQHNEYRAHHGAEDLVANKELEQGAQQWAQHLVEIGQLQETPASLRRYKGQPTGENVLAVPIDKCCNIEAWYEKIKFYNFQHPNFNPSTASFSQIVWLSTHEIGIGVANDPEKKLTYIVARYFPIGNIFRHFSQNVLPASPNSG